MNDTTNDNEMIKNTLQFYIDGAKSGKGNDMKPAFHSDATIFGYIGKIYLLVQYKNFLTGMIKTEQQLKLKQK
tara:strand:- start:825 stop:1043 length:219 start_codon:yes stop_codon:yes gene_type:complete